MHRHGTGYVHWWWLRCPWPVCSFVVNDVAHGRAG
jgi:hypothetical protein